MMTVGPKPWSMMRYGKILLIHQLGESDEPPLRSIFRQAEGIGLVVEFSTAIPEESPEKSYEKMLALRFRLELLLYFLDPFRRDADTSPKFLSVH